MNTRLGHRLMRRILTALLLVMLGSLALPGGSVAYGKDGADDGSSHGSDDSGGGSGKSDNSGPGSSNSGSDESGDQDGDEVDHRLKLEKTYDDGYRETVDRGVYILTDAKGRTVIRRKARNSDVDRFDAS